jgi:hypothetical protein
MACLGGGYDSSQCQQVAVKAKTTLLALGVGCKHEVVPEPFTHMKFNDHHLVNDHCIVNGLSSHDNSIRHHLTAYNFL